MKEIPRTKAGDALTELILSMFRANNLTLAWGDRLVAPFGLTSARWQVLGAIVLASRPQPVAWLARDLGVSRQNVQRIVNDLRREGLVRLAPNPHHRRAHLVVLTDRGRVAYGSAVNAYSPAVDRLAEGFAPADVEAARRVLARLRDRLAAQGDADLHAEPVIAKP